MDKGRAAVFVFSLLILAVVLVYVFSASSNPIKIRSSTGALICSCQSIDEEKRIAYNCKFSAFGNASEYHLAVTDGWSK